MDCSEFLEVLKAGVRLDSFDDAARFLHSTLASLTGRVFMGAVGLERSRRYLAALGSPQDALRAVHVAGTAGKGTVCVSTARVLAAHGLRVGLHVSPHVYDIRERIQIDSVMCTRQEFVELLALALPAITSMAESELGPPTFFEVTVGMAFTHFMRSNCDVVVVETGLGGTLDTTNVISRRDKLAAIAAIGLDHQAVLGDTVEEIAAQKAGILTGDRGFALRSRRSSVDEVIEAAAKASSCRLSFVEAEASDSLVPHQAGNLALTLAVSREYLERSGGRYDPARARTVALQASLPGRYEKLYDAEGRLLAILDGAHNPLKISALIEALRSEFGPAARFEWIYAARPDKDVADILRLMGPVASKMWMTEFSFEGGDVGPGSSVPVADLTRAARTCIPKVPVQELPSTTPLRPESSPVIVTGSFYLLSKIRNALAARNSEPV